MRKSTLEEFASKFTMDGDTVRGKGSSRNFDKYLKETYLALEPDVNLRDFRKEIMDYLEDNKEIKIVSGCTDPDKAVDDFIDEKDIRISLDGKKITMGAMEDMVPADIKELMKAWCHRRNLQLTKEDIQYRHEPLFSIFYEQVKMRAIRIWESITDDIAHVPHDNLPQMIAQVFKALGVSDKNRERFNADRLMFAHWLWLVKRRIVLNDYQPANQFMLVFRGIQGGGKTSFIGNHLGSVFRGKAGVADLKAVHEAEKEFKRWTENCIVNFDELSMQKLDGGKRNRTVELLKQLITTGETAERMYHTQTLQKFDVRATFCASTNKPLAESISDPTGMRRYWELICNRTGKKEFDWEIIENFDWRKLWQAVDENKPFGYMQPGHKLHPTIQEVQDTYCVQPSMRRWFEDNYKPFKQKGLVELTGLGINKEDDLRKEKVKAMSLLGIYGEYTDHMDEIGGYAISQSNFIGCLDRLGVQVVPRSPNHKKTNYYVVQEIVS